MKSTKKKISQNSFIGMGCIVLMALGMIFFLGFLNYRTKKQNEELLSGHLQNLATRTADYLGDILTDNMTVMDSMAYLYGQAIAESDEADTEILKELEDRSGFDRFAYVSANGREYSSTGYVIQKTARAYYTRGMAGKKGIYCENYEGTNYFVFFAPVRYGNKLFGVMTGFLSENTLSRLMSTDLYGYTPDSLVLNEKGTVLCRYQAEGTIDIFSIQDVLPFIRKQDRDTFMASLQRHRMYQFSVTDKEFNTIGYLAPIKGTNWSLIQTIPPQLMASVRKNMYWNSIIGILGVSLLFFLSLIYAVFRYRRRMKRKLKDNDALVDDLLRALSDDFLCLIDVDLKTEEERQFKLRNGGRLEDWSKGKRDYTSCIREYANTFVAEHDRERFIKKTRLVELKNRLMKQSAFYIEYDAVVQGEVLRFQGKFTIVKNDKGEEHLLVSIRDITMIQKERVINEDELQLVAEAAGVIYPFIMTENLTRNQAHVVHNQGIVKKGRGNDHEINQLIKEVSRIIPNDIYRAKFLETFSLAGQLESVEKGNMQVKLTFPQMADDGKVHWMTTRNIYRRGDDGEIRCISLTRPLAEEQEEEKTGDFFGQK